MKSDEINKRDETTDKLINKQTNTSNKHKLLSFGQAANIKYLSQNYTFYIRIPVIRSPIVTAIASQFCHNSS